jgi:hypothetical protein
MVRAAHRGYFGVSPRLPPGAPGGRMIGVLLEPTAGGAWVMPGSTPWGGWMTPPERSSLSLNGSDELPLVARSSGTVCGDGVAALWSLLAEGGGAVVAKAGIALASNRASAAKATEWRILGMSFASPLPTEGGDAAFLGRCLPSRGDWADNGRCPRIKR